MICQNWFLKLLFFEILFFQLVTDLSVYLFNKLLAILVVHRILSQLEDCLLSKLSQLFFRKAPSLGFLELVAHVRRSYHREKNLET
jgi:hypothetical protein